MMVDLERLDEALAEFAMFEEDGPLDWHEKPVVEAARAYRDMMTNAEQVESIGVTFEDVPEGHDGLILAVASRGWSGAGRYLLIPEESV